jgi:hypothetical protein
MADTSKNTRLGGLWKRDTPSGKTLFSGKISVADLKEAVKLAGTDELDVTVWLNTEKKTERSPDASLVVGPPWKKPEADDDVPF